MNKPAPTMLVTNLPFEGFYESLYSDAIDREGEQFAEYHADPSNMETGSDYEASYAPELRLDEEIDTLKAEIRPLLTERRMARRRDDSRFPHICNAVRSTVTRALADIEAARGKRAKILRDGCYAPLRAAFNDGAGETVFGEA